MTRAEAYRRLGRNHWIPALHGANWLGGDLRLALDGLSLGEEIELDYGDVLPDASEMSDAPRITIHRSVEDVITAQGPDGWLEAPGRTRWTWQALGDSADPEAHRIRRLDRVGYALLCFLRDQRGATAVVVIVPPSGPDEEFTIVTPR